MSPYPRADAVADVLSYIHEKKPEVIFFDIGNVLVSLDFQDLNQRTVERLGIPFETYRAFLDEYMHEYFTGHISSHHIEQIAKEELGITTSLTETRTTVYTELLIPNTVLLEAIANLSKTYTISCISNIFPESLQVLKELGIFDHFTAPYFSCEMGATKPDPLAYKLALWMHHASAEKTLFIDDKRKNLEGGLAAGMQVMKYYFEIPVFTLPQTSE